MKKRVFAFFLTLVLAFGLLPVTSFAAESAGEDTVEIYLSISHDADFLEMPTGEIMAFKKLNVPYFDLAKYGLQQSVFTSSQHFIVLTGVTKDGRFMVKDSYEPNYENWELKNGFEVGFTEAELIKGYDGGWIYEYNAMPEDPFIYVEEKPYVEPRYPDIDLTWEEQQLLAKVIWVEARGESAEGQQAIAEIVFNRMLSEGFPDTIRDVIFAENQFRSVEFLDDAEPWQAQYDAIDDALEGPYVLPADVYYFATYAVNENMWGRIGGHIFCYQSGN